VAHQHHGAVVIGAAVGAGGERGHQFLVIARVALLAAGRIAGIARRMHAGLAAQREGAETGIVCQRRQACALGDVARFRQRILDEGEVRLLRVRDAQRRLVRTSQPSGPSIAWISRSLPALLLAMTSFSIGILPRTRRGRVSPWPRPPCGDDSCETDRSY